MYLNHFISKIKQRLKPKSKTLFKKKINKKSKLFV